jgi:polysaccharide biosynthesis protein PslG
VRRIVTLIVLATAGLAPAAVAAQPARADRSVPRGFVGTVADGPLLTARPNLFGNQLGPMVRAGVESLRMTFDWRRIQPYATLDDVPLEDRGSYRLVDGVPTRFTETDEWVAQTAQRGITMLPVLLYAPDWAARHPYTKNTPPKDPNQFASFAAAMVGRYGEDGSFWTERPEVPRMPIEYWQVWNEPHFSEFWGDRPWAGDYVKLLRASYDAIHGADPVANVVLAGLANRSWQYLDEIYRKGGRDFFDLAAIHPFTGQVEGIVKILHKVRRVMRRRDDARMPLLVTEMSWTSAHGKTEKSYGIEEDEKGQAKQLRHAFKLLAAKRRGLHLRRVYWYTWMTRDRSTVQPFDYAGVTRFMKDGVVKKPAFKALRKIALALEGCASKSATAASCE